MSKNRSPIDISEARETIANDQKDREAKCEAAITAALNEFRCTLDVAMTISTSSGVVPSLSVRAKP